MRIVHINNIGGVAWDLRTSQIEMGDSATVIAHRRYSMNRPDVDLRLDGLIGINLELPLYQRGLLRHADIIHIHGGIRRTQFVFRLLRRISKGKWVLHYHGSESRLGYGMHHMDLADLKLVGTPDLRRWHEDSVWLPNPIEASLFNKPRPPARKSSRLRIGHFPNDPSIKGTARIERALKPLVDAGQIELVVHEKMGHDDLLSEIMKTDLVIDQLSDLSIYGKTSLEAMIFGIPAISSYDEAIFPSGCPIIKAMTEEELRGRVEEIVRDGIDEGLRRKSIDYVFEHHHPMKVARTLKGLYTSIM